jgi:hypothetical protein
MARSRPSPRPPSSQSGSPPPHSPARSSRLAIALVAFVALVTAACSSSSAGEVIVRTATPIPAVTATAAATATSTPTPTAIATVIADASATPTDSETITSLGALVKQFGDPPDSGYARIKIPVLGVDGPVRAALVGSDAVMTAPYNPVEVTWYDMRLFPGMGGAPGAGGNAIFSGHVDYAAHVPYAENSYYRGPGIFAGLRLLSPGDTIEIDYNGQQLKYSVTWNKQLGQGDSDWGSIWSSDVSVDSITLYTCGGDFDFQTREYSDRVVVRAERVS